MTTIQTNRRRRLIVDRAVQSRIVLQISWPSAVALAVTALLFAVLSMKLADEAMAAQIELPSLVPMLLTLVGFLVVSLGFLVYHALKLSHRIAGPMYRLQKSLDSAKAGDYTVRANLRERDFLVEIADSLNEFLSELDRQKLVGETPVADEAVAPANDASGPQGRDGSAKRAAERSSPVAT